MTGLSSTASNNPTAYKFQLGYQVSTNLAVEGGYVDLGKITYSATGVVGVTLGTASETDNANAWNIDAVGILPLGNSFSVLGKLGVASVNSSGAATLTLGAASVSGVANKTKTSLTYGVGAKYDLSKNFSLRADLDNYDTGVTGTDRINVWTIGVGYKF